MTRSFSMIDRPGIFPNRMDVVKHQQLWGESMLERQRVIAAYVSRPDCRKKNNPGVLVGEAKMTAAVSCTWPPERPRGVSSYFLDQPSTVATPMVLSPLALCEKLTPSC
jgi:hypothetical protein